MAKKSIKYARVKGNYLVPKGIKPETHQGQRFGSLEVLLVQYPYTKNNKCMVTVACKCGTQFTIQRKYLGGKGRMCCGKAECTIKHMRLPEEVAVLTRAFQDYRNKAKARELDFGLTLDEFSYLVKQDCFYCGLAPSTLRFAPHKRASLLLSGIDRVSSLLGYSVENCVPCCYKCNRIKWDTNFDYFISKVKAYISRNPFK